MYTDSSTRSPCRGGVTEAVGLLLGAVALLSTLSISWSAPGESAAAAPPDAERTLGDPSSRSDIMINPDGYTSARVCGRCHADIYRSWKNSLHAFSLTDPIFDAAYMRALKEVGDEAKRLCLRCHAPMTTMNQDYDLRDGVTREGVSCDFCHTVTDVDLDNPERPYTIELGSTKRSVLKSAASPAHEVAYSELHGTAEFCGACHNYVAPNGTPIMSTYDEWRNSPYAQDGVPCQSCHMVLGSGKVVDEEVKASTADMHLHNLIHDTDQLRTAMSVEIVKTEHVDQKLDIQIRVKNIGSGHKIPTGMPSREVVLTVTAEIGNRTMTQERRYRRVLADENGRTLTQDWEALLYGAAVVSDNRIGPKEERTERFSFFLPHREVVVTAMLSYVYQPIVLHVRQLDIELAQATKIVN